MTGTSTFDLHNRALIAKHQIDLGQLIHNLRTHGRSLRSIQTALETFDIYVTYTTIGNWIREGRIP